MLFTSCVFVFLSHDKITSGICKNLFVVAVAFFFFLLFLVFQKIEQRMSVILEINVLKSMPSPPCIYSIFTSSSTCHRIHYRTTVASCEKLQSFLSSLLISDDIHHQRDPRSSSKSSLAILHIDAKLSHRFPYTASRTEGELKCTVFNYSCLFTFIYAHYFNPLTDYLYSVERFFITLL